MRGMSELESRAIEASRWSFFGEVASKIALPVTFLIVARILSPTVFGVVAAATAIVSFSQILSEAGLGKALIHASENVERAANTIFWINLALGLALYFAILIAADWIAVAFADPRVAKVLRVQGLQLIIAPFCATHIALLQRELDFKRLFWSRLAASVAPSLLAIPLALLGWGVWSLVAGALGGAALQVVALWIAHPWRPSLLIEFDRLHPLLGYGSWVAGEGVLTWCFVWADALILGAYLGAHDLGLYRTGNTFVAMGYGLLFTPLLPVLFGYFSRMDRAHVPHTLIQVVRVIGLFALPLAVLAGFLGGPAGTLLFGDQWQGIGAVIAVMGLAHGIGWLVGAHGEAYRAVGRPDISTKVLAGTLAVYVPAFVAGAPWGLETFLLVRLLCTLVGLVVHVVVAQRTLAVSAIKLGKGLGALTAGAALMAIAMASVSLLLDGVEHDVVRLVGLAASGIAVYTTIVCLADRPFVSQVLAMVHRVPARG